MPAQGNVAAPLAVLRMKKPFIHEKKPPFHCISIPLGLILQHPFGSTIQCQQQFWEQHIE
jgi:hypothetical protein